jgi:hypothetical protein
MGLTSGVSNSIQAALGITQAQLATYNSALPGSTYPSQLLHGIAESNAADPGLIGGMAQLWTNANLSYRL